MRAFRPAAAILALPLFLSACLAFVGPGERDDTIRELVAARARWAANGPTDYTMVVTPQCFCVLGGQQVRVVVVGGAVIRRELVSTGAFINGDAPGAPVDQLFDVIEDAVHRRAHRIDATYDPTRGYPTHVFIDYSAQAADEEYGMQVESLVPTPR